MTKDEIVDYIINYLVTNEGFEPTKLNAETKLITTRALDSIATLNMLNHFEAHFQFEAAAEEVVPQNLDSPLIIAGYIMAKKKM